MILAPIWFLSSLTFNFITYIIVKVFILFQSILSKYFRPFPLSEGTIRNKNVTELHPTTTTTPVNKISIDSITDAIETAKRLKRFLVVFAHSELNDRSVAALESLRKTDSTANKLIREKFVFFAYSVLDRETDMTPGFLTSCRSLPAVAVFRVVSGGSMVVDLLATLEGAASGMTICLFLERCLSTY